MSKRKLSKLSVSSCSSTAAPPPPPPPASPIASSYIIESGYRWVVPWEDEWKKRAKGAWVGRRLDDVMATEFPFVAKTNMGTAFDVGRIRIDSMAAPRHHIVSLQDSVSMVFHRHEPEVSDGAVTVIHEDDGLVAVSKPASVPCHASGRFKRNTVMGILEETHPGLFFPLAPKDQAVHLVHRLDRLVSGVLLFARGPQGARELSEHIKAGRIRKEYLARVAGVFPEGEIVVREPIRIVERGIYSCGAGAGAKDAHTIFIREGVVGRGEEQPEESIVRCIPVTGRTHQLRLHLAHLGFPIVDDLKYGGRCARMEEVANDERNSSKL